MLRLNTGLEENTLHIENFREEGDYRLLKIPHFDLGLLVNLKTVDIVLLWSQNEMSKRILIQWI